MVKEEIFMITRKVKDLLKAKKKEVFSIELEAPVNDALKLMAEKEIGALMVVDKKGEVVGIITERDYVRKIVALNKPAGKMKVKDVMTPADKMFRVSPETSVEECMILMTGKHIRHLPVYEGGKYVGLISIGDAVKSVISEQELLIEQLSNYIAGRV